jgi:hypothetical protein
VLTTGGDQRGWPDFGGGGRRRCIGGSRSPSTGGAPVLPSRRAGAAEVQLDLTKLLVAAVSPAGLHGRRIEDGRWWTCSSGGARLGERQGEVRRVAKADAVGGLAAAKHGAGRHRPGRTRQGGGGGGMP